jgi:SAM-dependent methyltransferase
MLAVRNTLLASAARVLARARGRHTSWNAAMHAVKYDKALPIEADARREVCEFFGVSEQELQALEVRHGRFSTREFQLHVYRLFEGQTDNDKALFGAYADAAFYYSLMLGLGCPRYATLFPFLDHLLAQFKRLGRRPVAVDYGSGTGDTALLLSAHGFDVHLVDLPGRMNEFAQWRLRRRGFQPHWVPVTADNPYPALPNPTDLVVTIEVWEHLRDPVAALRNINAVTAPGRAYLMNTNQGFDYAVEGDHLAEGIARGRSPDYEQLYSQNWQPLSIDAPDGRLYVRK